MQENCSLCQTVQQCSLANHELRIHAFTHSYLMFGQHQFYPGYCVLVSKTHARELHHLPTAIRDSLWQELMQAGSVIEKVFQPWKLNYACYGNQVEHIHWHIFPRYTNDPLHRDCPFANSPKFNEHPTQLVQLMAQRQQLQDYLKSL